MGIFLSFSEEFALTNSKFEEACKESKLTKKNKIIKSVELDVIIAGSDSELEHKKRLFAMEGGPAILNKIQRHSLVGLKISMPIEMYGN